MSGQTPARCSILWASSLQKGEPRQAAELYDPVGQRWPDVEFISELLAWLVIVCCSVPANGYCLENPAQGQGQQQITGGASLHTCLQHPSGPILGVLGMASYSDQLLSQQVSPWCQFVAPILADFHDEQGTASAQHMASAHPFASKLWQQQQTPESHLPSPLKQHSCAQSSA